jgi:maltodextrin utilization protein YvdJ
LVFAGAVLAALALGAVAAGGAAHALNNTIIDPITLINPVVFIVFIMLAPIFLSLAKTQRRKDAKTQKRKDAKALFVP